MRRALVLSVVLAVAGCSRHLETASSSHVSGADNDDATGHAQASVDEHATENTTAKADEDTHVQQDEGEIDREGEWTFPDGGTFKGKEHRGTARTVTDTKKHDEVQKSLADDAKSLFGEDWDTKSYENYEVDADATLDKDSKPVGLLGLLVGSWPWLLLAIPVLLLVFRKKLAPLLRLLPFRIPFLSP